MEDKELKVTGDRTISMNEPLVHRGYTFYQSSYVEGTPMISIFQVAYDPGGPVAYIGFFGFMAGLFCIIWSRPKRASAAAAAIPGRE
jgi:cytochrome c biogenesis protein ResB